MRRYVFALLSMLVIFIVHIAWAQGPGTVPEPVLPYPMVVDPYRQLFSVLVPLVTTLGGPIATHWIKGMPPWAKYSITAGLAILSGFFGAEYTAYPMHPDAAVAQNLVTSMTAQRFMGMTSTADAPLVAQVDAARAQNRPTVMVSTAPVVKEV